MEAHLRGALEGNGYPKQQASYREGTTWRTLSSHPIGIHYLRAVRNWRSISAGEEVQCHIPSPVQLWSCIHRWDEESPWDPHQRAQDSYKKGWTGEAEHACNHHHQVFWDVGVDAKHHHSAHQRSSVCPHYRHQKQLSSDEGIGIPKYWSAISSHTQYHVRSSTQQQWCHQGIHMKLKLKDLCLALKHLCL